MVQSSPKVTVTFLLQSEKSSKALDNYYFTTPLYHQFVEIMPKKKKKTLRDLHMVTLKINCIIWIYYNLQGRTKIDFSVNI